MSVCTAELPRTLRVAAKARQMLRARGTRAVYRSAIARPLRRLLKIDVEGAEGRVIRGGRETIAAHRPRMIIEIHSPRARREVLDALPAPYDFTDVEETAHDPAALIPGHYLTVPADGR